MAQEIVGFKLVLDGKEKVISSIGEMKKLLKEANFELLQAQQNFGEYSAEAVNAAKKVATLKDTIQEAKETSDLFDPGKKFQAFAGAISAVAGGFSAVQGALGLVGVESQNVEKTLLKVQSALALSQGLNTIADSAKDFQRLSAIIKETSVVQGIYNFVMKGTISDMSLQNAITKATAATMNFFKTSINGVKTASITAAGAMRVLRGIIASIGIGALIFGVTALIDKISQWTSSTDDNKKAQDRLNNALEEQEKIFSRQKENLQRQREISVKRAQLANSTADEIFNINQNFNKKDREAAVDNYNKVLSNLKSFEKERLKITKDGKLAGSEEDIKAYNDAKKQLESANKEIRDIDYKNQQDQLDNQIRINEKRKKDREDTSKKNTQLSEEEKKKREQEAQERLEAEKKADEDIRLAKQENFLNSIKDEDERAKKKVEIDLENRNREIEALNIDESRKRQLKTQAFIDAQYQLDAIDTEIKAKQKQKDDQFAADQKAALDKSVEDAKEAAEKKKKIAEEEARVKIENARQVSSILSGLSDLFGKETAAGKATAIAAATINTYLAASQALTGIKKMNPLGATIAIAQAALVIANGLKQVKEIVKVKVPGGAGASGSVPSAVGLQGGAAPISPTLPIQNTLTQLDQTSINQLGSATNRSYVVESDITNSQERIRRINRAARLN